AKLPTCRELAAKWNVSYVTANRAIKQLADENYVDLNHGRGIFVCWRSDGVFPTERKIRIFASDSSHPNIRMFIDTAVDKLKALHWQIELITTKSLKQALELIHDQSCYSLVFGFQLTRYDDISALCSAGRERLVMVAERYERFGISSSCVDSSQVIRLAMNHLLTAGRRKIALLCTNIQHADETEYAVVWRNLYKMANPNDKNIDSLLFNLNLTQFESPKESLVNFLKKKYDSGIMNQIDAIISTDDEKAVIASGFCYDCKLRIPEDIALVAVNDSGLAEMVRPRLTTIDTALPMQIENAIRILESKVSGNYNGIPLRCVEPQLIQRESTPFVTSSREINNSKIVVYN
ncbi:MAG: LacI family DNA-binding transcriptional regulator, partial [Lentisphaeria bacterium]